MKLSERFDRRYQQAPAAVQAPAARPVDGESPASPAPEDTQPVAPVDRRAVPREPLTSHTLTVDGALPSLDGLASLTPSLAAAKAEIHADLLRRHAAAIDITNRAGIRRLLLQLTEEHFRNKPPAALVTAADRERLVDILFDEVIG